MVIMPKRKAKRGAKAPRRHARVGGRGPSRAGSKALEALRRTQQINEIVQRGGVENQALLYSGVESRPEEETHISALLESEEAPESTPSKKKKKSKK